LAAILFPVFAKAREKARTNTCINNQRQLAVSFQMFAQDHDQKLPEAKNWTSELSNYGTATKLFDCPSVTNIGNPGKPDYLFVAGSFLSGASLGDIRDPTIAPLVTDLAKPGTNTPYITDGGANDTAIAASLTDPRHNNSAVFAFVDGHVEIVTQNNISPAMFANSIPASVLAVTPINMGMLFREPIERAQKIGGVWQMPIVDCRPIFKKYGMDIAMHGAAWGANNFVFTDGTRGTGGIPASYSDFTVDATTGALGVGGSGGGMYFFPTWWSLSDTTYTGTKQYGSIKAVYGTTDLGSANSYYNQALYEGTGTLILTIVPAVDDATTRKMAIVYCTSGTSTGSATVTSIKIGDRPAMTSPIKATVAANPKSQNLLQACLFSVPVRPDEPIEIKFTQSGGGCFFALPLK